MSVSNRYASVFDCVGAGFTNQFVQPRDISLNPSLAEATDATGHDIRARN